jgi:hypothetical protein
LLIAITPPFSIFAFEPAAMPAAMFSLSRCHLPLIAAITPLIFHDVAAAAFHFAAAMPPR